MSEEEQQRLLVDSVKVVREQAFYMKREIDGNNLIGVIKHAVDMLRELKSNVMEPRTYNDLYMKVTDELRELEEYFMSLQRSGKSIVEIYEQVQNCGNIVPRLYLMICVGGVYITSLEAPAKDILTDLIEMVKGVQHPMRGLFLRNYLAQVTKNRLPDVGTTYEGIGGNVSDAVQFILQNFVESTRLWVRLQTQGNNSKDRKQRERERLELRILVGTNLVRLSQLEGLDADGYKNTVLPKVLEEVVQSKDKIAQYYLMDCIIQVFPDDFHLATLDIFLATCGQLKEKVNVRGILESLMDRLSLYSANNGNTIPLEVSAFKLFNDCVSGLIETRVNMSLTEILHLQTSLITFALKCYPSRIDYVSHCLSICGALIDKSESFLSETKSSGDARSTNETCTQIEALLSAPLASLALRVLEIPSWSKLMSSLPWGNWKEVAVNFVRSVVARNAVLSEVEQVEQLFTTIEPLLHDRDGFVVPTDEDGREIPTSEAFNEEQKLVAKVINLLKSDDTDNLLRIYGVARRHFANGGSRRIKYTFAPLVFSALHLARRVFAREKAAESEVDVAPQYSTRKVFHFVIEIVTAMATAHPELSLKLYLQAAQSADECAFHAIAYEFAKEALLIYESDIADSKSQVNALNLIIGTLLSCSHFPTEDYETLVTQVTKSANKLLKKPDQCRMVATCANLFWPVKDVSGEGVVSDRFSDPDRVLECLQRALKIAQSCQSSMFVEILDRYLYFFDNETPTIVARFITGLVALIKDQLGSEDSANSPVHAHFRNTLDYIKSRQAAADTSEKYSAITLQ